MTSRPDKNTITEMIEKYNVALDAPIAKARTFLSEKITDATDEELNLDVNASAIWEYINNRQSSIKKGLDNINWSTNDLAECKRKLEQLKEIIEKIQSRMNKASLSRTLAQRSAKVIKERGIQPTDDREAFVLDYELMDKPPRLEPTSGGKTKRRKTKHSKSRKKKSNRKNKDKR
jgi:hypothetical protein